MTRVHFTVVGERRDVYSWAQLITTLYTTPREGETVHMPDGVPMQVRRVAHYPWGTDETPTQFVYVVLGD